MMSMDRDIEGSFIQQMGVTMGLTLVIGISLRDLMGLNFALPTKNGDFKGDVSKSDS